MDFFDDLSSEEQDYAKKLIKGDSPSGYNFYRIKEDASGAFEGEDDLLIVEPKDVKVQDTPKIDPNAY